MSNPAPTLNQINAFNATQGTTISFNIIGGTEVIRSNRIYIYDLSDNSLICTHLYVSTESIHELPANTDSSMVYASGKSSADFTNNTQYYAQIQTFTDTNGTQGASGLSIAKLFWCLPTPTLTLSTIPTTISTTSYNVSATYTPNTSGSATNEIQEFQFNLYSAIGALLQTSGVVLYGEGVDLSYNFSGLEVDSTYYVTLDVTTTQGMNVSAQSNTFTVSIDTPTMGSASVVNNGCDGYISVTSNLSSEYSHSYSVDAGEIMSFTTDSPNNITKLQVDFNPIQDGTPWMSTPDTEPYMFRAVPTQTEDFGHESDTIVGDTVAWNQLVQNGNFENTSHWTAYSNATINGASGGVLTFIVSGSNGGVVATNPSRIFPTPANEHKYIAIADIKLTTATTAVKMRLNGGYKQVYTKSTTEWQTLSCIYNLHNSDNGYLQFGDERTSGWDAIQLKNVMVVDLTQMFGSTIADYIYSLETANAGAGVAWFRKLFPNAYYPYDAGSLISVSGLTSHDMVGFNQWDEVAEEGAINWTTGATTNVDTNLRSKNYVPCIGGETYYIKAPIGNTSYIRFAFYDNNNTFVSTSTWKKGGQTVDVPTDARYMKFSWLKATYGSTTYQNDICINLSDASLNGTYKPYVKHSYSLDSDLVLRGIPKLDASNNLYYDGDTYESDGTVTRKYGIVDLGDLNWGYNAGSTGQIQRFNASLSSAPTTLNTNIVCAKYVPSTDPLYARTTDKAVAIYNGQVYINDSAYSDTITFKTAVTGTKLVYELATPTTETADPYTNPQIVDPHGTEQYVGSPIPVGHKTTYQRICLITGWTGCEVDVSGVNLFDDNVNDYIRPIDYFVCPIKLEQGGYYTASVKLKEGKTALTGFTVGLVKHGNKYVDFGGIDIFANATNYTPPYTRTLLITSAYDDPRLAVYTTPLNQEGFEEFFDHYEVQFEKGTIATPYTPYQGTTYTSTFPKYKQQVTQDKIPYITKNIGDTYADTLTENLVGGTIAWNQSVPDTTTTHTISGSIASMDDAVAGNFESVVCDIEPVQDLHGYDKPWVGGAGKNKFSRETINVTAYEEYTVDSIPAGTYVFSTVVTSTNTGENVVIAFKDADGNTLVSKAITPNSGTRQFTTSFTTSTPIAKIGLYSGSGWGGAQGHTSVWSYNMVADSSVTSYEPYENLCPITGWTGCEVTRTGKNLFDKSTATDGKYYQLSGGTINEINNALYGHSTLIPIKPSTSYCMTGYAGSGYYSIVALDEYMKPITTWYGAASKTAPFVATTPNNAKYCYLNYPLTQKDSLALYEATSVGDFIPYTGTTYPVSWQTEAGTVYGGTVDVVSGVLTVDKVSVDLGSLNWDYSNGIFINYTSGIDLHTNERGGYMLSDRYAHCGVASATNMPNYSIQISGGVSASNLWVKNTDYTDKTSFKTAMNGVWIVYQLADAYKQTYQLDPVQMACLLGQNNVWNNISNTIATYPTNHSYQSLSTTHKYYKRINGVESISVGSDVVVDVGTDNIIDLTQMFGTTIADYIYNIEQSSSSGMGVKFFKSLFPNDDYDYNSGTLISVNASAHVIKDANGNVLHTYPLDSDLVLRGIPKLDANNKLYYDGDVYEPSGNVTRKYGIVDLGTLTWTYVSSVPYFEATLTGIKRSAGWKIVVDYIMQTKYLPTYADNVAISSDIDKAIAVTPNADRVVIKDTAYTDAASFKTAMSGVYLVYELATPTTEQADPFEENQAIVSNGIEEYTVTEQGDVEMPVGHDSTYYVAKVYGGTIDMASGVLTITHKVQVLNGTESWSEQSTSSGIMPYLSMSSYGMKKNQIGYSDKFPNAPSTNPVDGHGLKFGSSVYNVLYVVGILSDLGLSTLAEWKSWLALNNTQIVYELETPIKMLLTPQQMQTLSGQNNIWSNTNGGMFLIYQLPITSLLVKRRDVADVSGKWLTLYSTPITQADDMDFTFIDFLNQYGKTYQYALVPVLAQDQSGVIVQIEGGYTVSDNVDSIFDGVYIADQTNVERVKAGVGYGNIDMNQGVGSITPIGSKYPIVITNSQNQYHNGSVRGTIVPNDFYSNGNLSRIDMVNKRDELEQFLTNKRAKIIKDWNGKMWLVMIMSNVSCSFDDNYGMGMVSFSADWLEVGDPTSQQDLYNAGLINVGGV